MTTRIDMVEEMLASLDRMDVEQYAGFFADDATFRFANHDPVRGREQIAATCRAFLQTIGGLRHDVLGRWDIGDVTVLQLDVHYERLDGSAITVPVAVIVARRGTLVAEYQIYADMAPVSS